LSHVKVTRANGIDFNSIPAFEQIKKCIVVKQLGYGEHGVCCLALTENAVACVIKFYHVTTDKAPDHTAAKKEAEKWREIYGSAPYNFSAKSFAFPSRAMLVMPYIQIPRNFVERNALVEGEEKTFCTSHSSLFETEIYPS
jgi:hypothetical protein